MKNAIFRLSILALLFCLLFPLLVSCAKPNDPDKKGEEEPMEEGPFDDTLTGVSYVQKYPYTDEDGRIHIRYQDTYDCGSEVKSQENVLITSKVCLTDTPDSKLLTVKNFTEVYATAVGSATVVTANGRINFVVEPSPISLLFVSGQSNASGDASGIPGEDYTTYARTRDTMAYVSYANMTLTTSDADELYDSYTGLTFPATHPEEYVVKTLKWGNNTRYSTKVSGPAVTALSEKNKSKYTNLGWSGGLAREWVEQTDERVWIINASHGGHSIQNFIPVADGGIEEQYNDYEQAVAMFKLALQTLYAEVDAGHFTLSHMGYYWFHGESDECASESYYTENFAKVHNGFMRDVKYNHNGVTREIEFCGIMAIGSTRDTVQNSLKELYMIGPRTSHYNAANASEGLFANVFIASNVTEEWFGSDANVEQYFLRKYGTNEAFKAIFGYDMPKTLAEVKPNIHYWMQGHNEMGTDAAKNTLLMLNRQNPAASYVLTYTDEQTPVEVKLLSRDGYTEIKDGDTVTVESGYAYVLPRVTPLYRAAQGVTLVSETEGVKFEGYRLLLDGKAPESVTFSVRVHGKFLKRYTLHLEVHDAFSKIDPVMELRYGGQFNLDRVITFHTVEAPWSLGYYDTVKKVFTPFTAVESDGWIHKKGENRASTSNHGGFDVANGFAFVSSLGSKLPDEDVAICYTVRADGKVTISFDELKGKDGDFKLTVIVGDEALLLDGEGNTSLTVTKKNFSLDGANALFAALILDVKKGETIRFLLTNIDRKPNGICQPVIHYVG